MRGPARRIGGLAAWSIATAATAWPLLTSDTLPLVDLPQHEALISVLRHWNDPACGYPAIYEIHPFNPYWLAYFATWALSFAIGVGEAARWVVALTLVAIPFATFRLARALGGEPRFAIAVFPFVFATPTAWGFFTFLVSVPLVLAGLPLLLRQARAPGLWRGLAAGLFVAALFAAHMLTMIYALVLFGTAALVAAESGDRVRGLARRLWPALLAFPCPLLWWWVSSRDYAQAQGRTRYLLGFDRFLDLPVELTGIPHRGWAFVAVAATLAALYAAGARPGRDRLRWAPFATTLVIVLLGPNMFFGTSYLASRFTIFLLPTLVLALDRVDTGGEASTLFNARLVRLRPALPAIVAVGLVAVQIWRFAGMEREGKGLAEILAAAPAGGQLLYLDFDRGSRYAREPIFLHSGQRYAVDRCGVAERSMARHFQIPIRFRAAALRQLPPLLEYNPLHFKWEKHGGDGFDLVLVRTAKEPDPARLAGAPGRLELVDRRERWWLFRRIGGTGRAPG